MQKQTYFISYTTRTENDVAWAEWLEWVVRKKLNAKTTMQKYDFPAGCNFKALMDDALKLAGAVICVLTHDYLESANCKEEWTNADKIIPVRFDDCTPKGLLKSRVYIDLFGMDKESAQESLIAQIKGSNRPEEEPYAPFASREPSASSGASGSNASGEAFSSTEESSGSSREPSASSGSSETEPDFPDATVHNLPMRNGYFTGRKDILSKIYKQFQSSYILSVTGAGGFGKTQIAVEYAYKHISEYKLIWYFNAESETQLQNDYREFAIRKLHVSGAVELDFPSIKRMIDEWFRTNPSYLLIYDNAEDCTYLKKYLPQEQPQSQPQSQSQSQSKSKCNILINSRERLEGIVAKTLPTTVFSLEESVAFLQKRIADDDMDACDADETAADVAGVDVGDEADETAAAANAATAADAADDADAGADVGADDAKVLAEALGCLPLALECAVAYINENGYTFKKYLEDFKKSQNHILGFLNAKPKATEYEKTILTVWSTTFEKISREAECDEQMKASLQLFKLCTYCASEDIPLQLFINGRDKTPQPLNSKLDPEDIPTLNKIISNLTRYSLVSMRRDNEKGVLITVHRLIQAVANYNFEQNKEWVDFCLNIAASVFKYQYGTREEFDEFSLNLLHVTEIARHAETLLKDDDSQGKIARIYSEAGIGSRHQGNYANALEWHYKALAIREKVLSTEHPDTAATYNNIAGVYQDQGEYPKAVEWYYKALAICEKVLGAEHPSTATTYNNIACVYQDQGEYPKSLEWNYKALAIDEKVLGAEHPSIATTYNNIAGVYQAQGKYEKSLEWNYKALAIDEKVLGAKHTSTATTYNNIAGVYQDQGEYPKALEWYYKALAIKEKVLGAEHPNTGTTYNNIALVYQAQGKYEKSLEWHYKALAICEKVLGEEHPDTGTTYNNIAGVYQAQGEYEKALEWNYKALAICEKVLGEEHPSTAVTYSNIAFVYQNQGNYEKALEWYYKALAIKEKVLGEEHPSTAVTYNNIADVYHAQGKYAKA